MGAIGWKFLLVYCCWIAVEAILIFWLWPETSGRTLEELAFRMFRHSCQCKTQANHSTLQCSRRMSVGCTSATLSSGLSPRSTTTRPRTPPSRRSKHHHLAAFIRGWTTVCAVPRALEATGTNHSSQAMA
jgi:hypothetical protein